MTRQPANDFHPKPGQRLGRFRLLRHVESGGFGGVFDALDTVENVRVAVKVPSKPLVGEALTEFRKELALHASLDHPNILPVKTVELVDSRPVVSYPLALETLGTRMQRSMSVETFLTLARQMLEAVAYLHGRRVVHCDLKPDNFLLFEGGVLRLADFGLARVIKRPVEMSGSGTVGYVAPEQAMGQASPRSDVFSLGLVMWEMLARRLPVWPFEPPLPGEATIRRKMSSRFVKFLERSVAVDQRQRWADGRAMLRAFRRITDSQVEGAPACASCGGGLVRFGRYCPHCGERVQRRWLLDHTGKRCPNCRWGVDPSWTACSWCGRKLSR